MNRITDRKGWKINGFAMLILLVAVVVCAIALLVRGIRYELVVPAVSAAVLLVLVAPLIGAGLFTVQPNQARVLVFFGRYVGTVRDDGFWWTNPFTTRQAVSLRVRNFTSDKIKVNDAHGNPIEIAAVVVWRVVDSAEAVFDVDSYVAFVGIQSETAIRGMATRYPYDASEEQMSLRGSQDAIAEELRREVQERLKVAGVEVIEARLTHLAYASEIAQAMLRRQQAQAVIAARRLIVEAAVGMVEQALQALSEQHIVVLDEERKAAMVNNLMVVLTSEQSSHPVINTGSLYS